MASIGIPNDHSSRCNLCAKQYTSEVFGLIPKGSVYLYIAFQTISLDMLWVVVKMGNWQGWQRRTYGDGE